jgi:hypothetical protein
MATPSALYNLINEKNKDFNENTIIAGLNAIADSNNKLILLPEREGLLDSLAAHKKLKSHKLQTSGLTDIHIYASYTIHEASHVIGLSGRCYRNRDSFNFNEVDSYLHEFTRFMRVGGFGTDDPVPNLLANIKTIDNIQYCFDAIENNDNASTALRYQFTHSASEWGITRANSPATMACLWDQRRDKFYLSRLRRHMPRYSMKTMDGNHRMDDAYIKALRHLKGAGNADMETPLASIFSDRYTMRNAAMRAASKCLRLARAERKFRSPYEAFNRPKGSTPDERAALILRRLARAIDHVTRYADDYRPPASDIRITHRCRVPQLR